MDRDHLDHIRFCPLQTAMGRQLCATAGAPVDLSTAVLIDQHGAHIESAAILRMFAWMGFPFTILGPIALLVPCCIRDTAYRAFSSNRGAIWKMVRRLTGWGETHLEAYRGRIIGLEEPLDPGWGFEHPRTD